MPDADTSDNQSLISPPAGAQTSDDADVAVARLRVVLDVLPVAIAIAGVDGTVTQINAAFRALWGEDAPLPESVAGYRAYRGWWEETGKPLAPEEWTMARVLMRGETVIGDKVLIESFDGQYKHAVNNGAPIRDAQGAIIGGVIAMYDVTDRVRAEETVEASERRFRSLIEHSADVIVLVNPDGSMTYASESVSRVLGYSAAEYIAQNGFSYVHPDDKETAGQLFATVLASPGSPVTAEIRIRHQDGSWRWAEVTGTNLLDVPGIEAIVGNFRDTTARRAAEQRYRNLFEETADAILITDERGQYIDANPATVALVGYSVDELRQLRVGDLTANRHTPFALRAHSLPSGAWRGELELRRKDGTVVPVEGWITTVDSPTGTLHIGTWRDISERREQERQQQEFIAMMTHELRNPLTSLKGYAQLMRRRGQYSASAMDAIVQQVDRMERLTRDLRDVAHFTDRDIPLQYGTVDPRDIAVAAVEQAQATTTTHALRLDAPAHLPPAWWDGDRIAQVLANLLSNAIKYSPAGGEIVVQAEDRGDTVRFAVTDHGIGIPAAGMEQLFRRFYRAENARESSQWGMGVGLHISRALVEAHGGEISVESVQGVGSTFIVTLPYALPAEEQTDEHLPQ